MRQEGSLLVVIKFGKLLQRVEGESAYWKERISPARSPRRIGDCRQADADGPSSYVFALTVINGGFAFWFFPEVEYASCILSCSGDKWPRRLDSLGQTGRYCGPSAAPCVLPCLPAAFVDEWSEIAVRCAGVVALAVRLARH